MPALILSFLSCWKVSLALQSITKFLVLMTYRSEDYRLVNLFSERERRCPTLLYSVLSILDYYTTNIDIHISDNVWARVGVYMMGSVLIRSFLLGLLAHALHHELVLDDLGFFLLLLFLLFVLGWLFLQLEVSNLVDALDFAQGQA